MQYKGTADRAWVSEEHVRALTTAWKDESPAGGGGGGTELNLVDGMVVDGYANFLVPLLQALSLSVLSLSLALPSLSLLSLSLCLPLSLSLALSLARSISLCLSISPSFSLVSNLQRGDLSLCVLNGTGAHTLQRS